MSSVEIVATNALITPEQFQDIRSVLGQEISMEFDYHTTYSDEEPSTDERLSERFILKDVNFITDGTTGQRYVAFFREQLDDATYFPYWSSEDAFGDVTSVRINSLRLPSGEILWCFNQPGSRLRIDKWGSDNILQRIKAHSERMSDSRSIRSG